MTKLKKMIAALKTAQFAAQCPKGKRGRPLSPASAQKLGDQNICEKQRKDGQTVYYKTGETKEKEGKIKAERKEKGLNKASLKEAKQRTGLTGKRGRLKGETKEKLEEIAKSILAGYSKSGVKNVRQASKRTKPVSQLKKVSEVTAENIAAQIERTKDFGYAKELALNALKEKYNLPEDFDEIHELEAGKSGDPRAREIKNAYETLKSQYSAFTQEFITSPQGKPFVDLYKKKLNEEVLKRNNEKDKALKAVLKSDLEEENPEMFESVVKELKKPVTLTGMADAATSIAAHVGTILGLGAAVATGGVGGGLMLGAGMLSQVIASAIGGGGSLGKAGAEALSAKTGGVFR